MSTSEIDDIALLNAWRAGDMKAFDRLYQRFRQPLFLFLMRRGHGQAEAEELFQDCWMKVIDHSNRFDGEHFKAWLYTVARNLSTDRMRKHQPELLGDSDSGHGLTNEVSTERVREGEDCIELVRSSVAALPIEQRDVFLLQHEAGLSLQQIADLMAVGRETIKSRVRYAMDKLKQLLADCI